MIKGICKESYLLSMSISFRMSRFSLLRNVKALWIILIHKGRASLTHLISILLRIQRAFVFPSTTFFKNWTQSTKSLRLISSRKPTCWPLRTPSYNANIQTMASVPSMKPIEIPIASPMSTKLVSPPSIYGQIPNLSKSALR